MGQNNNFTKGETNSSIPCRRVLESGNWCFSLYKGLPSFDPNTFARRVYCLLQIHLTKDPAKAMHTQMTNTWIPPLPTAHPQIGSKNADTTTQNNMIHVAWLVIVHRHNIDHKKIPKFDFGAAPCKKKKMHMQLLSQSLARPPPPPLTDTQCPHRLNRT